MLRQAEFPILEFDDEREAVIQPIKPKVTDPIAERCVLCFMQEVIDDYKTERSLVHVGDVKTCMGPIPIYQYQQGDARITLLQSGIGSALSAGIFEEIIALGCRKFIACGTCGVLSSEILPGQLVVPTAAVRDEGISYHYMPPSREIGAQSEVNAVIEATLKEVGITYHTGKVWTMDAFYRETKDKISARVAEGCIAVEMEVAALLAVARFRGVELGYVLLGDDDVSGEEWDRRKGGTPLSFRRRVIDACIRTVLTM